MRTDVFKLGDKVKIKSEDEIAAVFKEHNYTIDYFKIVLLLADKVSAIVGFRPTGSSPNPAVYLEMDPRLPIVTTLIDLVDSPQKLKLYDED